MGILWWAEFVLSYCKLFRLSCVLGVSVGLLPYPSAVKLLRLSCAVLAVSVGLHPYPSTVIGGNASDRDVCY